MPSPRWRKVARDLWLHRTRTVLVVLALAAGSVGAGAILDTWALVERATREEYRASNPPAATIHTDSIDAALLERVRALPFVAGAEGRRTVVGGARTASISALAMLFAVDDFTAVRIGTIAPEVGAWPPGDGALVIERSSVDFSGAGIGELVSIAVGKGEPLVLPIAGIARDVGLAPGWMEHVIYGFVTPGTLERLGVPSSLNELRITLRDPTLDRDAVRRAAHEVKRVVEGTGRRVTDVEVPPPGEHVHAAQMNSLLYTQGAFGLLALVLSAFLVVNLLTAMLAGQVREIGVMKAIGARPAQLARMYLGFALGLGALATALSLPAAAAIGRRYGALKAELLNVSVAGHAIPAWVVALQAAVGLLLPVLAAAVPVARSCRIPVAAALRETGVEGGAGSEGIAHRIGGLGRPVLLSLRNAFRRRQRLVLTLLALAAGGAVYLGARNLRASIRGAVDLVFAPQRYDFSLRLAGAHAPERIEAALHAVPGVARAEAWGGARAAVKLPDGTLGDGFPVTAPPPGSRLLVPAMEAGRWLRAGDGNALVVNRGFLRDHPQLAPGAEVTLIIGGRELVWTIVGVAGGGVPSPAAWVSREAIMTAAGDRRVRTAVVAADLPGPAAQVELIQRIRGELDRAGLEVATSQLVAESRRVTEDHLLMVADFLGVMAWVMIVVGGLGLASTMSLAVLERTREIGVLRAIGASRQAVIAIVETEGLAIGLLSWALAVPLSLPISVALGQAFGRVMLPVPVRYLPEGTGVFAWLGLVLGVAALASAWPALRATRITTAAALAYE